MGEALVHISVEAKLVADMIIIIIIICDLCVLGVSCLELDEAWLIIFVAVDFRLRTQRYKFRHGLFSQPGWCSEYLPYLYDGRNSRHEEWSNHRFSGGLANRINRRLAESPKAACREQTDR